MPDAPQVPVEAAEDPLAADRRTLTIGAISVVVLILIGVVSAQLFARGGCTSTVSPEPADTAAAGDAVPEEVVDEVLGPVDGARAIDIVEQAAGAPVSIAVPVGEATRVATLAGGLVTTGATVTSFDHAVTPVATFETDDVVTGDGDAIFDLTVPNEATGQTDAFAAVTGTELTVGACVDAAVVGSPFAFLLDAGDGELLLFRAEEDGDAPHLQLRGGDAAAVWDHALTLPAGPPGTLAERLTADLGPDTVVAARRVGPQEETTSPALVAVARDGGQLRFELDGDQLAEAGQLDPDGPIRWAVAAVGSQTALLHGRPDPQDVPDVEDGESRTDGSLVLLDLADGSAITAVTGVGPLTGASVAPATGPGVAAAPADETYVVGLERSSGGSEEIAFLDTSGGLTSLGTLVREPRFAWVDDGVLVAARDSLSRLSPQDRVPTVAVLVGGRFADVTVTDDGRVATLVTARDGGDAVLLVTEPVTALASGG